MKNNRPAGTYHIGDWTETWWRNKGRWVVAAILDFGNPQQQRNGMFARMRNVHGKCTPYWVSRDELKDVVRPASEINPGEKTFRRDNL